MSISPVKTSIQNLGDKDRDALILVCRFVDNTEVSKVNKTFRDANRHAIAQIFREKRATIQLGHKLPEEREPLLQLIEEKISEYERELLIPRTRMGVAVTPVNLSDTLRPLLQKYRDEPDHFFAIQRARRLLFRIDQEIIKLKHPHLLLGISKIFEEHLGLLGARLGGAPVVRVHENQWNIRINQSLEARFTTVDMQRPLEVCQRLKSIYEAQKKWISFTASSREVFRRTLISGAPLSISHSLSRFPKIEEVVIETQMERDNFFNRIREELYRLGVQLDPAALNTNEGLSHWLYDPNHENERQRVTTLNFWGSLIELPPEIGQFSRLRHLYLNGCALSALPDEIANLSALESLSLEHNRFERIPPVIARLTSLRSLSLQDNRIQELAPFLANLPLNSVHLARNLIGDLHQEHVRIFGPQSDLRCVVGEGDNTPVGLERRPQVRIPPNNFELGYRRGLAIGEFIGSALIAPFALIFFIILRLSWNYILEPLISAVRSEIENLQEEASSAAQQ